MVKGQKKIFYFVTIFLIIGFMTTSVNAEKKPILIGHIGTISGGMAMYGIGCQIGGEIAVDEINQAGGILGRPVKQITRDDKLKPDIGLKEATDLVMNENVDFLTGTLSSSVAAALSAYVKEIKKIFIATIASSTTLNAELGHKYYFRWSADTMSWCGAPVMSAGKVWGDKKMFLINPDYDYGRQCYNSFSINYKKVVPDFEIVGEVWPKLGTTDFSPYISKILSSGATILCSGLYGGDELKFVKQAVPYGLYKKMHVVEPGGGDSAVWMNVKTADAAPIGALSTDRYPYWMLENSKSKSFTNKYRERGKTDPNYGAMNQYNIIYALKEAIEAVGAVDTEKIIKYWENRVFNTALGPIKMRGCDHQAMIPEWIGQIGFGDGLDYPHVINGKLHENIESTYRTCEEIAKIRREVKK